MQKHESPNKFRTFDAGKIASTNSLNEVTKGLNASPIGGNGNGQQAHRGVEVPWRITAKTALTADKKWKYTVTQQTPKASSAGGDGYVNAADGYSGISAYNDAEERNDQTGQFAGQYGNAVTPGNIPTGFTLQSLPVGRVFWGRLVEVSDGVLEVRFSEPNSVDGTCSTSSP